MVRRLRILAVAASLGLLVLLIPAAASGWTPTVYPIGVDHQGPANHDFEYVDFFPRHVVKLHMGDVVDFGWARAPDGLHTATLLKSGKSVAQALQDFPVVVPDGDDPGSQLQVNPAVLFSTLPPPGSGAPGACGDAANPCTYDGSSDLNSGAFPTDGTTHFFTRISALPGTVVNFICLIHPGMVGSATVVPENRPASGLRAVQRAAAEQAEADTAGAFKAEEKAEKTAVQRNPDGTRTITMTAGTASPFVEVVEMLPRKLRIRPGDTVRWVTKTIKDIHTVTFPNGPQGNPIPQFCESPGADTPLVPTAAGPPCGNPALFEIHFQPEPQGTTVISNPTTFGSSGIISSPPAPFPNSYAFSFPNQGTFNYVCKIHENGMLGTVVVKQPDDEGDHVD